jgi:hypothetical protein
MFQASPVDEDPGRKTAASGAYQGSQDQATGILAMLDTIITDFKNTIEQTSTLEKEAQRNFVGFRRTTKATIAGYQTRLIPLRCLFGGETEEKFLSDCFFPVECQNVLQE